MNQTVELFTSTAKENLVALQEVTTNAHAVTERLVELNLATTKNLMSESLEYAKAMIATQDPQSLLAIQAGLAKPVGEIANAFAREFQTIMASAGSEFVKAAQGSMVDVQRGITFMMVGATKNAPSGVDFAVNSFNQVMAASQKMFESAQTSTEQTINTVKKSAKTA